MARPLKEGIGYFTVDVDMDSDDKIYMLEVETGMEGFGLLFKILMKIYRNSYYIEWTEREAKILSKQTSCSLDVVNNVVNVCNNEGIFDKNLYDEYKILTSSGIQKRFIEAIARRKQVTMIKEYLLIDVSKVSNMIVNDLNGVNVYNNLINVSNNSDNADNVQHDVDIGTQSKVDKSKGNKNKDIYMCEVDEVWNYYCEKLKAINKTRKKTANKTKHIHARLEEKFSVDQLKQVIDNVFSNDFMLGKNEQKKMYIEIDNFMCNTEKIEKWLEIIKPKEVTHKPTEDNKCPDCKGEGVLQDKDTKKYYHCPACNGTGKIKGVENVG